MQKAQLRIPIVMLLQSHTGSHGSAPERGGIARGREDEIAPKKGTGTVLKMHGGTDLGTSVEIAPETSHESVRGIGNETSQKNGIAPNLAAAPIRPIVAPHHLSLIVLHISAATALLPPLLPPNARNARPRPSLAPRSRSLRKRYPFGASTTLHYPRPNMVVHQQPSKNRI